MKCLKLKAMTLMIAGLPLAAQADLKPLQDEDLGNVTGQAGVTIELETRVEIGEFVYTDEGSFAVQNITLGGANRDDLFQNIQDSIGAAPFQGTTELLDDMQILIDVAADGDAIINIDPLGNAAKPVDFGVTAQSAELRGTGGETVVMENLSMEGGFLDFQARVDTATDSLNVLVIAGIDDLDVDVPFLALGIRDMRVLGTNYFENQAGGSLNILDMAATLDMTLQGVDNANSSGGRALQIDVADFSADIDVGGVLVGGTSIGSVRLDNLSITDTTLQVYGHN